MYNKNIKKVDNLYQVMFCKLIEYFQRKRRKKRIELKANRMSRSRPLTNTRRIWRRNWGRRPMRDLPTTITTSTTISQRSSSQRVYERLITTSDAVETRRARIPAAIATETMIISSRRRLLILIVLLLLMVIGMWRTARASRTRCTHLAV